MASVIAIHISECLFNHRSRA